jgi:alanine racemase
MVRVAKALSSLGPDNGIDGFGVACINEALMLREAGISEKILLLEGFFSADELTVISSQQLEIVLHHQHQLAQLLQQTDATYSVWLKIDTGMHRIGISPHDMQHVFRQLSESDLIAPPIRLMTHFPNADDMQSNVTQGQIDLFSECVADLDGETTSANSAGIVGFPQSHMDWVRPGIMLYGVSPFPDDNGDKYDLKPVMTASSELIAVNRFQQGDAVGYGGTWVCPEDMPVGVVSFGYGDGYPRHARCGTPVLVNGKRVPLIGRVSMDMLCVDLREQVNARIGDPVVLWGEDLPVEEVARSSDTIGYELLCGITSRVTITESS